MRKKREYEKYIKQARGIDIDFQRTLYTKYSFIEQYDSLYDNKGIFDGEDLFGNDLMNLYDFEESIEYALASYEDLLERFSSEESVNYDEAHKFILKHLKSASPDIKRKRKKLRIKIKWD